MYARTIDTSVPTPQSYVLRTTPLTSVNIQGSERGGWGTDSTFIIHGNYRTYDGWTGSTANATYPGTTGTTISGGWMRNGYTENNGTYYSGTHLAMLLGGIHIQVGHLVYNIA